MLRYTLSGKTGLKQLPIVYSVFKRNKIIIFIYYFNFSLVALPPEVSGSSCSVKVVAVEKGSPDVVKPPLSPTMSSNSGKATVGVSLVCLIDPLSIHSQSRCQ